MFHTQPLPHSIASVLASSSAFPSKAEQPSQIPPHWKPSKYMILELKVKDPWKCMNKIELKNQRIKPAKKGWSKYAYTSMKWFSAFFFEGPSWPRFVKHCPQHSTSEIWTDSKTTTLERTGFQDLRAKFSRGVVIPGLFVFLFWLLK